MTIVFHNTLGRTKQPFVPREEGKASIYFCGPTVYNHIHIGNARASIAADLVRRYLTWRGFEVTFVHNYTDVDDRIIERSQTESVSASEITQKYSRAFEEVMKKLNVSPPDVLVLATEHIGDMVEMIEKLIGKGFAYESSGNVWFAVERFEGYGKLSGRTLEDVRAGERVEPDATKRNPLDFALWKSAKPGEPSWPSPWGQGRPGWHIECSAMSVRYLGMGFDIHCGGSDLVFPHHENEIAQSEAAMGSEPFVRYWLHNGMVNIEDTKMSKSLGNFVLAKDLLDQVPASVIRFMGIAAHYRSEVDFGDAALQQARKAIERFDIFLSAAGKSSAAEQDDAFVGRFTEAMDDDLNTPLAISVLHDIVKEGNSAVETGDAKRAASLAATLNQLMDVLGIQEPPAQDTSLSAPLIDLLLELREGARGAKRFSDADLIRDRLTELGVIIEDTAQGTRWRLKV